MLFIQKKIIAWLKLNLCNIYQLKLVEITMMLNYVITSDQIALLLIKWYWYLFF